MSDEIHVTVNGTDMALPPTLTVRGLIVRMGLDRAACAAEVNRELVPRREQETRPLRQGDRIELVTLVGGG